MVAGHLQEKKGFFYIVLNCKDEEGKRKPKWIPTGLTVFPKTRPPNFHPAPDYVK